MTSLLAHGQAFADQVAYTDARGYYTVKVSGASQPAKPVRTYLGIQLLPDRNFVGRVAGVDGNTVTMETFSDHYVPADPETKRYLHVLSGTGRGFVADIDEFGESGMACGEDLTLWMQPGTQIQIRPHSRLMDLLGVANKFGLGAGVDADTADNVVVWDPDAQQERVYYFNATRARWEEKGIVGDASLAVFRFPYGFYIVRRSSGSLRIALSGEVGADAVLLPVRPAANVFSLPVNLSGSLDAIVSTDGAFPVLSGRNARRADILTFEEPSTGSKRGPFYHLSRPGVSSWREVGFNGSSASIQPLDFLSTLIMWRSGDAGRVLVEGSLDPPAVPRLPLPPDAEPDELPLTVEFPLHQPLPPGVLLSVETSTDLQVWETFATPEITQDLRVVFDLPSGQGRAFYRLKITLVF